jgi:hypothetical protein
MLGGSYRKRREITAVLQIWEGALFLPSGLWPAGGRTDPATIAVGTQRAAEILREPLFSLV